MRIKAFGGTRAGLLESALKGLSAASAPEGVDDDAEEVSRPFAIKADDADGLLVAFLKEALAQAAAHREAYVAVRFDLITATEAKGSLVGRPATGFGADITEVTVEAPPARNEENAWETTLAFA